MDGTWAPVLSERQWKEGPASPMWGLPGLQVGCVELCFPDHPFSQQTMSRWVVEGRQRQRQRSEHWSIKGADKLAGHMQEAGPPQLD